jgi:DNA-binding response OmpR family regulator
MKSKQQSILVVDDEVKLRELLKKYLSREGFIVTGVEDGQAMDLFLADHKVDLIILDLMLPGEDGLSIARRLRQMNKYQAIIMLSARADEVDRIVGLEVGADDYLPKPFSPRELLARIRSVLRRSSIALATPKERINVLSFGLYNLNLSSYKLSKDKEEIPLSMGEFTLLRLFLKHPNHVLTRDKIIQLTKGYERISTDRSIDICVGRLRKKIEIDPANPTYLRTIWGAGYLFSLEG